TAARPRLLVIDDEAGIRTLVRRVGRQAGFEVQEAGAAVELRASLQQAQDVIALDLAMPDIDGIEVIRELAHAGCKARLILISGFDRRVLDTAARLAAGLGLNLRGALPKPFSVTDLLALLRAEQQAPGGSIARLEVTAGELRRALDAGELVVHFQPQVEFADGSWRGVEALVRWQHPRYGLIQPAAFIPLAQTEEFAIPVTQRVLELALAGYSDLLDTAGFDGALAINIPGSALSDVHFPEHVVERIAARGIAHRHMVFEVTETSLANQPTVAADILARLRIKGFNLSIDDFGTGYSSLESLHRLPFTELKIDMQFVQAAETDGVARAIVENSIELAKQLGMKVIAEGVQTAGQWRWLKARGCHLAQGYLVSRPLPAADLRAWGGAWRPPANE
ncbi:MAG: EAL domain-containing response regulator, partial [Gammaproteobacteria bacterium]|nr:EAL domain-containing response regulator [Gammaproteobacteria bacterium]